MCTLHEILLRRSIRGLHKNHRPTVTQTLHSVDGDVLITRTTLDRKRAEHPLFQGVNHGLTHARTKIITAIDQAS